MRLPEPPVPKEWLLDANVLFSDWARWLCIQLSRKWGARIVWTPLIEEEAWRNLVRLGRLHPEDAADQRLNLFKDENAHCLQGSVDSYLADVRFVDDKDRHVAAAALLHAHQTQQNVALVTWNLKDFPRKQLLKKGIVRYSPDELMRKVCPTATECWDLLHTTKRSLIEAQTLRPLKQPTSFVLRALPWPEHETEWMDFLGRNRLNLVRSRLVSGKP